MFGLVLTLHVIVSVFLVLVVLLQTGKGGDIASAFGGGGTQTVFGPRGTSNVLTKATTASAVIFMLTSIALVILSQGGGGSVLDSVADEPPAGATQPAPTQPALPPAGDTGTSPVDLPGEPGTGAAGEAAPAAESEDQ